MDLTTVFKLSIYGLTAAVGLILGAAENGWVPFVSLPMTLLGYWWCEVAVGQNGRRLGGLGDTLSLVFGGVSLAAATAEFFGNNPEGKLLSGIHLVVYLTWIVLLQRKHDTRYWQLLVLGVLQVAVASVLTNGTWFGLSVLADRLRTATSSPEVTPSPSLTPIGDLFYRVRFGDQELPAEEASRMNELLTQLEQALGPASSQQARSR